MEDSQPKVSPCWDPLTSSEQSETEQIENKFSRARHGSVYILQNKPHETTCQNRFAMAMNFKELSLAFFFFFFNGCFFPAPLSVLTRIYQRYICMFRFYCRITNFHANMHFETWNRKNSEIKRISVVFFNGTTKLFLPFTPFYLHHCIMHEVMCVLHLCSTFTTSLCRQS